MYIYIRIQMLELHIACLPCREARLCIHRPKVAHLQSTGYSSIGVTVAFEKIAMQLMHPYEYAPPPLNGS